MAEVKVNKEQAIAKREASALKCKSAVRRNMMRIFVSGALLLLSPLTILATPCAQGSLQTYVNLGSTGCELGNWQFASFTLGPVPPFPTMDPTLVNVTPGGTSLQPELLFTVNQTANAGEQFGLLFHFVVTGALDSVSLQFNSPSFSGDGVVWAYLDVCPDGFFTYAPFGCPSAIPFLSPAVYQGHNEPADLRPLPNASFYHTSLHLYLDGQSGTASLESASIQFNSVPEPDVMLLTLAGLGAICFRRYLRSGERTDRAFRRLAPATKLAPGPQQRMSSNAEVKVELTEDAPDHTGERIQKHRGRV